MGVIEAANNSDHRGRSNIIRVINMGRLIMWNTKHMWYPNNHSKMSPGTDKERNQMIIEYFYIDSVKRA